MTSQPKRMYHQTNTPDHARQIVLPLLSLALGLLLGFTGCTSVRHAAEQTIEFNAEEGRVDEALQTLAATGVRVPSELGFAPLARTISEASAVKARARALAAAKRAGEELWHNAVLAAHSTPSALDDRPLYWQRLLEKREFKKYCPASDLCRQALDAFELASRGATDLQFKTSADLRILVSGFDPFSLDRHIDQSNPSGAAALALDGLQMRTNGKTAEIQSVLFPVRFADFDEGMVESIFEPFVTGTNAKIDMLITISMGRSGFDLERFPGRRRSATAPDNLRVKTGANSSAPTLPLLNGGPLAGPEFVEFSLPVEAMTKIQAPYSVNDNHNVATLQGGRFAAETLASLAGQTAVNGSGGGYLSNEISYRTVRLVQLHNRDIAVGHLHTPRIESFDQAAITAISNQIQAIIQEAIHAL